MPHFTAYDCNYGVSPPRDAGSPRQPAPIRDHPCPFNGACDSEGSQIERQNQVLGEAMAVAAVADGVIVGSAIVRRLHESPVSVEDFVRKLREAI